MPTFTSLLDQIAQQEQVLKQQAEEAAQKKAEGKGRRERRGESEHAHSERKSYSAPSRMEQDGGAEQGEGRPGRKGRKGNRRGDEGEDRYSPHGSARPRHTTAAAFSTRLREAVEEASRESTGRRRRRKERRQKQAEEAAEEKRIEVAIANEPGPLAARHREGPAGRHGRAACRAPWRAG